MSGGTAGEGSPYILTLDVGSSSVKASWYTPGGRVPGIAVQVPYGWTSSGGAMEVDAERLLSHCADVIDQALEGFRESGDGSVAGVAIATFWHGLVGVNRAGEPVTPLTTWGDARAFGAARRLRSRMNAAEVHQRTGCFLWPRYPAVRLRWLHDESPDLAARVARWMSFGELLMLRLFGEPACSVSMASATGLLDLRRMSWDDEVCEAVGISTDALSPVVDASATLSGLRSPWRSRWPELADVLWVPPLGDGACANVGAGAAHSGDMAITVGTSAAVRTLWRGDPGTVPSDLWCYRLDRDRPVCGAVLANAGNGVAVLRRLLRLPPGDELEAALAAAPMGDLPTVVPNLWMETDPTGDGRADGAVIAGLRADIEPVEVMRAWMASVAVRLAALTRRVDAAFGSEGSIRAGGGALLASPTWTGMLAAALERPVRVADDPESTARGAALMAAEVLGLGPPVDQIPPPDEREVEPDPECVNRMRGIRDRQLGMDTILRETGPS